ncbi:unnamed protein product [Aphis gossypii]|uniref:Uncharacterized protein n=1 Tax=Aphis gossypii TaxID=80765 RepID=A0A9P0IQ30_APHGO|nr:unnamed protein product [Aphis gossypii]
MSKTTTSLTKPYQMSRSYPCEIDKNKKIIINQSVFINSWSYSTDRTQQVGTRSGEKRLTSRSSPKTQQRLSLRAGRRRNTLCLTLFDTCRPSIARYTTMKTRSHHSGRCVCAALMAVVAAAAVSVSGKPHQCLSQDDYARAMLAQYFPAAASSKVIELTPTELPEPTYFRSSRSDDRWTGVLQTPSAAVVKPPPLATIAHSAGAAKPQLGGVEDVHAAVAAVAVPCKAAVADPRAHGNDTSSAVTVEKLAAFYEQLKSQQETLARQQFQQQLYEQQQRRQQEFQLVQQQIQQQYYQQQQHAMMMLDQMRKNPAFVRQLASFVDHKMTPATALNGTSADQRVAAALPEAVPEVVPSGSTGANRPSPPPKEKDQTIANHMEAAQDDGPEDDISVKHLDARQAIRKTYDSSEDGHRRVPTYDDDDDDDSEDDAPSKSEDESQ